MFEVAVCEWECGAKLDDILCNNGEAKRMKEWERVSRGALVLLMNISAGFCYTSFLSFHIIITTLWMHPRLPFEIISHPWHGAAVVLTSAGHSLSSKCNSPIMRWEGEDDASMPHEFRNLLAYAYILFFVSHIAHTQRATAYTVKNKRRMVLMHLSLSKMSVLQESKERLRHPDHDSGTTVCPFLTDKRKARGIECRSKIFIQFTDSSFTLIWSLIPHSCPHFPSHSLHLCILGPVCWGGESTAGIKPS